MKYNDKKFKYPARYDLEQVLGFISKRSFVEDFAKKRGIFFSKTLREDLGGLLSLFFFDHYDLLEIQESAFRSTESQNYTGFVIHLDDESQDPVSLLQNLRDDGELDKGMEMTVLARQEEEGKEVVTGTLDYVKKKIGKIELLQEESYSFDFKIQQNSSTEYEVFIDGTKASDTGEFKKLLKKKPNNYRFDDLDQNKLSSLQTIAFFDNLAEVGMDEDWNLTEVRQLVLRSDLDDEEMVVEDNDTLAGIKQAVLDGKNLRENPFVKQTESSGYRFISMTYRFQNSSNSDLIDVLAEFKLRPKVFIVKIISYYRNVVEGNIISFVDQKLDYPAEVAVKNHFLREARKVFKEILRD